MSVDVLAPPLGTTVDTVTLVNWYKREGESVRAGEPLFAVETDKATLDVESPASGILRGVACQPGEQVQVLTRIALIETTEVGAGLRPAPTTAPAAPRISADVQHISGGPPVDRRFISPRAKRMAEAQGVEWMTLDGTGPEGAIVERDVQAYLETRQAPKITPVAERMAAEAGVDWTQLAGTGVAGRITRDDVARAVSDEGRRMGDESPAGIRLPPTGPQSEVLESVPLMGVRALIAERLAQSSTQTAQVTLTAEADATGLVDLRAKLKADGIEVSYNDLFIAILARGLREHPRLNASLQNGAIKVWKSVHIGLAVDSERGLIVPVVRDVDQKGLAQIASETQALVEAVQQGKASPDDLRGATFTLTNLGMYGIDAFTPIINLPECAILGVGRIAPRPAAVEGRVEVRPMVWLSLTFDHRIVDGGPAARFLQRVVELSTRPHLLLT
jgi:pyruvate dehydrogenase E2 component (dihydrolipoamide acetyltransferase)